VAPGLSVIIDAIKESRKIFQRMNSYAMYRIAETLRVLLFMTLAIVVFNFYPLTAIMIVMLALLNDGAILSIAYDNVIYRNQPEAWNMRLVLGIATVLGLVGPIAAFGLFYLGDRVLHIDRPQIQTMMYLLLSVAGHLTIFQTRTRGPWWSTRPATILLVAVVGTQTIATLICLFGFLVTPLWWGWAAMVWAYALAWFLLTDPVKLLAYRVLDATKAAPALQSMIQPRSDIKATPMLTQPESKADPQPDPASNVPDKAEPQPEAKIEPSSGANPAPEPEAKAKPQPAAEPTSDADTTVTALMNTTLGELLVAGALKHPEDAGQILADGLVQTKAHIEAGKAPPPKVDSNPESEVKAAE
jgi:H+-transporting ATPase